jgi:hypothetical protein
MSVSLCERFSLGVLYVSNYAVHLLPLQSEKRLYCCCCKGCLVQKIASVNGAQALTCNIFSTVYSSLWAVT